MARQNAVKLTAKGRATRERIVSAAVQLMNDHGVARTTILDVQGAAGVSPSQMYHYFSDKRDLVSAVVDHQSDAVLGSQELALAEVDSIAALSQWRNMMVETMRDQGCVGGCPIGSLASELSETDPLARAQLERAFARWEELIRVSLTAAVARGELPPAADVDRTALALLAAVEGGLLVSQVRRDTVALEAAIDAFLDYLRLLAGGRNHHDGASSRI
jgi:TetR/AcrR family transcriptional regulator, transcriptional repressor for nem operon